LPDAVLAVRVDAESAQTNADLKVVVLTADSLDDIRRIHVRYILTPAELVRASLVQTPVSDAREGAAERRFPRVQRPPATPATGTGAKGTSHQERESPP
jgi:hypothetical protein